MLADAGVVAVLLGGHLTQSEADDDYMLSDIGSGRLPGLLFYGDNAGDRAGNDACGSAFYDVNGISTGADFNGDGVGDLLIVAPEATDYVDGQERLGVVFLIFGGPHLQWDPDVPQNNIYRLDPNVGVVSAATQELLPGLKFVSPYQTGTKDEAAPQSASFIGDINADAFGDILIGNPLADFVSNPNPGGRRNDAGEGYIIYGNNTGCNNPVAWALSTCFGE